MSGVRCLGRHTDVRGFVPRGSFGTGSQPGPAGDLASRMADVMEMTLMMGANPVLTADPLYLHGGMSEEHVFVLGTIVKSTH